MWLDKDLHIAGKVYVVYAHVDGNRLVRKDGSNYKYILNTTISSIFKTEQFLIIKADPANASQDTAYYKVAYNELVDSNAISRLSLREYDLLKNGQIDLLKKE